MIRSEESLTELIQSHQFIPYVDEVKDDRNKNIRWTILGDARYDLLWVVLDDVVSETRFIECIKSIVPSPMIERVNGIDPADAGLVQAHADDMWNKYKDRITDDN